MKIVFASYQSIWTIKGGPRTQIFETKKSLEKLGIHVQLFDMWQAFEKKDCDVFHIFGSGLATYHFAREINKLDINVVVSPIFFSRHTPQFIKNMLGLDKMMLKGLSGVWTDYRLISEMLNWSKAVLPNTKKEAELLENGLGIPSEKIFVVPNGVSEKFLDADPSLFVKTYGINNFILNVGHIGVGRKNVFRLVQALRKIDKPAVIIGRMEPGEELEKIKKAAGDKILLLENIPNNSELLASAYAACDAFVLPSLFETPGIAALEASLAGAKIVITKYGGTEEYFGDYAEYVEPASIDSIASGIQKAIEKQKDNRLRDHIKENYLWDKVGEKTLEVYKKILSE